MELCIVKPAARRPNGQGDIAMNAVNEGKDPKGKEKATLDVTVFAPRAPEPKHFSWAKTMKVGDAAKEAALAFGYSGGNPGLQTLGEGAEVLDPDKPLVAAKVKDGDQLELTDRSGGV